MKTLQQVIAEADRQKVAIGHFNVPDLVTLKAVYAAAREVNVPVETQQQNCRNLSARKSGGVTRACRAATQNSASS